MRIERFEDIECWQEARKLIAAVYSATQCGEFAKDFGLRDQLRRASVSVMANIAEGFGRESKADFLRFLVIARASVTEVQSHLYVALDLMYVSQGTFDELYSQAHSVRRLIGGMIHYLSHHEPASQPANRLTGQPANRPTGQPANRPTGQPGQPGQPANRPTG